MDKNSQLNTEQKATLKKVLTIDYMFSEYSASDNDNSQVFVVSKLKWQSKEVNKMFSALDEKHKSRMSRSSKRMLVTRAAANEWSLRKFPSFAVKEEYSEKSSICT